VTSVLLVEDSETDALVLRRMLEKHGFSVNVAVNGEQGIHRAIADQPDVIVMDVVMPEMNGFQATRELRRMEPTASIPVIMVSSKQQKTDRIWGMRQGAFDYLFKPVSDKILASSITRALSAA